MKWTEETIKAEILRVMELMQLTERLPNLKELAEHTSCGPAAAKYGGLKYFAELMGLPDAGTYNREKVKKTCPICGKTFLGARQKTIYCSKACASIKPHACAECGTIFLGNVSAAYCSKECRAKANRRARQRDPVRKVYDGIRPSRAFEKTAEANAKGLTYADVQKLEYPVEPINIAAYAGMKIWAERQGKR